MEGIYIKTETYEQMKEQLRQAEINFALEHDDVVQLREQLAAALKIATCDLKRAEQARRVTPEMMNMPCDAALKARPGVEEHAAELAKLHADAERYRWLRTQDGETIEKTKVAELWGCPLDAAIDAAMQAQQVACVAAEKGEKK